MVGGCVVGPDFARPSSPGLDDWNQTNAAREFTSSYSATDSWWYQFQSPELIRIVENVLRGNFSLQEACHRIHEARALRNVARSSLLPDVAGIGSYAYRRLSRNGNAFIQQSNTTSGFDFFSNGFDASWELDLFGRVRRQLEASSAEERLAVDGSRDIKVTLIAEAARTFVEARILQERIHIAIENIEIRRETVRLTESRRQAGLVTDLDVAQAESDLFLTEATLPPLQRELQVATNRLCILQGYPPAGRPEDVIGFGTVPVIDWEVGIGLPCELVRRRPDIRAAEDAVAAESARIGVAIADLYPQFSLSGAVSVDSRDFPRLFSTPSLAHNVGPSFRWNLLNFGRVRNSIAAQRFRYDQSVARYRQTVLDALEEVEAALVATAEESRRSEALQQAAEATDRAFKMAATEYRKGIVAFQTVLDAQRQLLSSSDEAAASRGAITLSVIRVYKALGGGWHCGGQFLPSAPSRIDDLLDGETMMQTRSPESVVVPASQHRDVRPSRTVD